MMKGLFIRLAERRKAAEWRRNSTYRTTSSSGTRFAFAVLAAMFLAIIVIAAHATEREFSDQMGTIRFSQKKCEVASVLRFIEEADRPHFLRGDGMYMGQRYFLCYRELDPQPPNPDLPAGKIIFLVWEDGDKGVLHETQLKAVPEI